MVRMNVTGGDELAAKLRKLPMAVRKNELYRILREAGEPMRSRMEQLAPRSTGDRGNIPGLADSMSISVAKKIGSTSGGRWEASDEFMAAVAVGPSKNAYYGIFQEYGTVHHGAQSFARPAFDGTADTSLKHISAELWTLLVDMAEQESSANKPGRGTGARWRDEAGYVGGGLL